MISAARLASLVLLSCTAFSIPAHGEPSAEIRILSSRPDMVSGGDALVQVKGSNVSGWRVRLNGRDITTRFRPSRESGGRLALVDELRLGENSIEVVNRGKVVASTRLVNHSLSGPIFSGPHQAPFVCQTEANGLLAARNLSCHAPTVVRYFYKPTALAQHQPTAASQPLPTAGRLPADFKVYDPANPPPPTDIARTETSGGSIVSFIVRQELGVINRAVYHISLLHQPGQPLPTPWDRKITGWNGRLVYAFDGGCAAGYRQGILPEVSQTALLAKGYAIATSTLNVFGNNCNDRISAETLSMVKEHLIEQYGVPVHTMGIGGSGGAIQQYLIAQNFPGLLDGILPAASFPDLVTIATSPIDCSLLGKAFATARRHFSEDQKTAVSGFATWRTCEPGWSGDKTWLEPRSCDAAVPKELVYDPDNNPGGIRCSIYDNEVNIFGRSPRTGRAYRPLDNVGVQYGLLAFNSGTIDAEQFLELNERIGGYDEDGNLVPARMSADPEALSLAYRRGLVFSGASVEIPIIDYGLWYTDDLADVHDRFRALMTRARLVAANGHANNQAILLNPRPEFLPFLVPGESSAYLRKAMDRYLELVPLMDRWLDNIDADRAPESPANKVARNRPDGLADGCWATTGERIVEPVSSASVGRCAQLYPPHGDPRIAAGAPLRNDVLKCALRPVTVANYAQPLSVDQLARLKATFPMGVCDYGHPGVGQPRNGNEPEERTDRVSQTRTVNAGY